MRNYKFSKVYPTAIWIEPTNVCNLHCSFCFQGNSSMTRPKGMMDFQLFREIINDIKNFNPTIILHHSGESFLHKNLFKFIRYSREKSLNVRLTTNGTMLDKENFGILDTGINNLNISLAGVDEEDYRKLRLKCEFDQIKEKIVFLATEKVNKNIDMEITINVILTKYNKSKINQFKNFFNSIEGVNRVIVRGLIDWSGHVDIQSIKLNNMYYALLTNLKKEIKCIKGQILKNGSLCDCVYKSAGILWDGTIVPCCFDFNGVISLGNIREKNFLEIWNGEEMIRLRTILKSKRLTKEHSVCGPCIFQ